jgi:phenylalanyl-tRNA synthetase beta chain
VLAEAVKLLGLSAGAKRASDVADSYPGKTDPSKSLIAAEHMNAILGTDFSTEDIVRTLENVEFAVSVDDKEVMTVVPPYWRTDIHISEDVDEEVGRLNGFDNVPATLPKRDFTAVSPSSFDQFRSQVRDILARAGANEVLTYSFVHGDLLQKSGQDIGHAYKIVNSLSPDLQYYRLTLTPSLLSFVHPNRKAGYDEFALFEMNKVHSKRFGMDEDNTPREVDMIALTLTDKNDEATYYRAKKVLDYLGSSLRLEFVYTPIDKDPGYDESAPFDFKRSAMVSDKATGEYIGIIGEYKASVKKALKLDDHTAGFELDPKALHKSSEAADISYRPLSRYPSTGRDVTFKVAAEVAYKDVLDAAASVTDEHTLITVQPMGIYQSENASEKNITLRFVLEPQAKTLTSDEANSLVDKITAKVISDEKIGGATIV